MRPIVPDTRKIAGTTARIAEQMHRRPHANTNDHIRLQSGDTGDVAACTRNTCEDR
jgi:hypothetical protein